MNSYPDAIRSLWLAVLTTLAAAPNARAQAVWGDPGTGTFASKADAARFSENDVQPGFAVCSPFPCLPTRRYATAEWNAGATCAPAGGPQVLDPCSGLFGAPLPGGPADPLPLFDPSADCFAHPNNALVAGFGGHYAGGLASASADYPWPSSRTPPCAPLVNHLSIQADAYGRGVIDGIGSSVLSVRWKCHAINRLSVECLNGNFNFCVRSQADLHNHVAVTIDGVPTGQPVTVHASWYLLLNTLFDPEAPGPNPDDPTSLVVSQFRIAGADLLPPGGVQLNDVKTVMYYPPAGGSSTIAAHGGDTITIDLEAAVMAAIRKPGDDSASPMRDRSWATLNGVVLLSLDAPITITPPILLPAPPAEFSLDIGSDTEMSDPQQDFDEVFDPGDTYPWNGPALPLGGADGIRDDALIFGVDYWPQAPDTLPPATAADTCNPAGVPVDAALTGSRFDLDGTDTVGADLADLIPANQPLSRPLLLADHPIGCVYRPNYLIVSFDDDAAGHYVGTANECTVPANSQSRLNPALAHTYGATTERDEVVALAGLTRAAPPALQVIDAVGIRDEEQLHVSLTPTPDFSESDDDDVDALDVEAGGCNGWYVSSDHEATGLANFVPLDPGDIYRVNPLGGSPLRVIDDVIHLGLRDETDVDAFEFVWLLHPSGAGYAIAVLFSVDVDDPLTPGTDESGGLDPRQIYASFLDGGSFDYLGHLNAAGVFVAEPLDDNVDALAVSPTPYTVAPCTPVTPAVADDFEGYRACAPLAGQGGWTAWPNPPGGGALVTTTSPAVPLPCGAQPAFSGAQAALVQAGDDVLQPIAITPSGVWTVSINTFVPSSATGAAVFVLFNDYDPLNTASLPPDYWSIRLRFDASQAAVIEDLSGDTAPLLYDQWVPVRVAIDLAADHVEVFYNGFPLHSGSWTHSLPQAALNLAVVDLLGHTSTGMLFDDLLVARVVDCNGNNVADACDIAGGFSTDCNTNGVPDECDLAGGSGADCNGNAILDDCENPSYPDYNGDGHVGAADATAFLACFTGVCPQATCVPALYANACCHWGDSDADGDIDLRDFAYLQQVYTGP